MGGCTMIISDIVLVLFGKPIRFSSSSMFKSWKMSDLHHFGSSKKNMPNNALLDILCAKRWILGAGFCKAKMSGNLAEVGALVFFGTHEGTTLAEFYPK